MTTKVASNLAGRVYPSPDILPPDIPPNGTWDQSDPNPHVEGTWDKRFPTPWKRPWSKGCPTPCVQTNICENITFLQLCWQSVINILQQMAKQTLEQTYLGKKISYPN